MELEQQQHDDSRAYRALAASVVMHAFTAALDLKRCRHALEVAEEAKRVGWRLGKPSLVEMKRLTDAVDYAHGRVTAATTAREWLLGDSPELRCFAGILGYSMQFVATRLLELEAQRTETSPPLRIANQHGVAGSHNRLRDIRRAQRRRIEAFA